jgi:hypothetical protein
MKIHTFEIEIEEYLREREGLSPEEYARLPMGAGVGTAYTGRVMLGGSRSMRRSSCEATHPHRTGPLDGGRYHHFVHQAAPSSGSDGGVGLLRA